MANEKGLFDDLKVSEVKPDDVEPKDKHYRTISPQFARKNFVQITAGYVAAHKVEGACAVIDGDPAEFFAGKQYEKEEATHFREQTGHNHAYSVGYVLGREECKDAPHPPRTLADFFREEGL